MAASAPAVSIARLQPLRSLSPRQDGGCRPASKRRFLTFNQQVWEIRGADVTVSPVHKAALGLVHAERGLSLRFPRFIRKRPDKRLADATTPEQLAAIYRKQAAS